MGTPTTTVADMALPPKKGFLDLSAELKNKIYRLSLCADLEEDAHIELRMNQHEGRSVCADVEEDEYIEHGQQRRGKPRCVCPPNGVISRIKSKPLHLAPGILRTCKQVHAEATSVLYGENAFALDCWSLANSIQLYPDFNDIRFLKLGYLNSDQVKALAGSNPMNNTWVATALKTLENMLQLRILSIEGHLPDCAFENGAPRKMARDMAKNLSSVVESLMMRSRKKKTNIREVLKLSLRLFGTLITGPDFQGSWEDIKRVGEFVYEELEARLDGDGGGDDGDGGEVANDGVGAGLKSFSEEPGANTERERKASGDSQSDGDGENSGDEEDTDGEEGTSDEQFGGDSQTPSDGEDTGDEEDTDDGGL